MKRVVIELDDDFHKKIKIRAITSDRSITVFRTLCRILYLHRLLGIHHAPDRHICRNCKAIQCKVIIP